MKVKVRWSLGHQLLELAESDVAVLIGVHRFKGVSQALLSGMYQDIMRRYEKIWAYVGKFENMWAYVGKKCEHINVENLRRKYPPLVPCGPLQLPHHQVQELVPFNGSTPVAVRLIGTAFGEKIWQDMKRYEKIWECMRRYEKIWEYMTGYEEI